MNIKWVPVVVLYVVLYFGLLLVAHLSSEGINENKARLDALEADSTCAQQPRECNLAPGKYWFVTRSHFKDSVFHDTIFVDASKVDCIILR